MREPQLVACEVDPVLRITPACAGTTSKRQGGDHRQKDHPRVCGNHRSSGAAFSEPAGSPPRVREPPGAGLCNGDVLGITPACAGTTCRDGGARRGDRDHPRVCGNHAQGRKGRTRGVGSPPRVREPLLDRLLAVPVRRITPACAGTTSLMLKSAVAGGDHPRVCGNHSPARPSFVEVVGSPPRVREPLAERDFSGKALGITPACAGTTALTAEMNALLRDHPRVCGNHIVHFVKC